MKKVLLVEDSPIVVKILRHLLKEQPGFACDIAMSRKEAEAFLSQAAEPPYFAAIVDLNLPDAPNGEVVDLTLSKNIPTLVLTGSMSDDIRQQMEQKPIVDYIVKESRFSYEAAIAQIDRLEKNTALTVMVVDDSGTSRKYTKKLLERQLLNVIEADSGEDALQKLHQHPEIILLVVDYHMPGMNGIELTRAIRKDPEKNHVMIIGISSQSEQGLSARFIKNGANDFLTKPFSHEEFNCRITQNIQSYEQLERIRHIANTDYLTNIPNRRYFSQEARKAIESAQQLNKPLSLVLLDLDNFKKINDMYGHDAGDKVLQTFAARLAEAMPRFLFARTGGEEFCILLSGLNLQKAVTLMENFRELSEDQIILLDETSLTITFSAGVVQFSDEPLEALMKRADEALYNAKLGGKNQICTA